MELTINRDTRLCMSLSARPGNFGTRFQNHLYRELGLNFVYKAFASRDLPGAITGIRALGIRGCAVSMPFKEACIPLLDQLHASAAGIESVNTIVNDDGRLTGFNTDYAAVLALLRESAVPLDTPFVVRGSGGMAKAVVCALRDAGFRRGRIVARNPVTGPRLAERYGFAWQPELAGVDASGVDPAALLINVTPIGMTGGPEAAELAFPEEWIRAAGYVFDVVAVPPETPLVRRARDLGKPVTTGAQVIVLQAVEQFALYTGVRPSAPQIDRAARFALA